MFYFVWICSLNGAGWVHLLFTAWSEEREELTYVYIYNIKIYAKRTSVRLTALLSHVILNEWLAFYSVFWISTEHPWLVPRETAVISACSVYTIQPCTMSCHFMYLPPALLAEWPGPFMCYCGSVDWFHKCYCKWDKCQTMHGNATHSALHIHFTCSNFDHISRSQQCQTNLIGTFKFNGVMR